MKRMMIPLLTAVLCFSTVALAETVVLTLEEALAIGLRENRSILLKSEDVNKAKMKLKESYSGLWPLVSVSGGVSDIRGLYDKNTEQKNSRVTVTQDLYTGGKTVNTIKFNKQGVIAAEAVLDQAKVELILNIKKGFYSLILARELKHLNGIILSNTREHAVSLHERYKKGQASASDMLSVESSLAGVQEAYNAAECQVESARELMKNLLCLDESASVAVKGELLFYPQEAAYDEAFAQALSNRPEFRQYEAQRKAQEKAIAIAKAENRPRIYASWDYYNSSHLASGTVKNWNDYTSAAVTVSWPLFDGWETKAKVEQAIIDLKALSLLREQTTMDIALELKNAYLALQKAFAGIRSAQSDKKLYEDGVSVIRAKFKVGMASFLDLSDSLVAYEVALFNEKQAVYDYVIARADFDKAMGGEYEQKD